MPRIMKQNKKIEFFIEDFMVNCKLKELSMKTMDSYEKTLKLFAKYLEEEYQITSIEEIVEEHINDYLVFTKNRGKYSFVSDDKTLAVNYPQNRKDLGKQVSDITINNYIRNIKVFFNWLLEKRIIRKSPMDHIKFLKTKRKMKEEITNEEFKRLIKSIDTTQFSQYRDYVVIQLIFDTGMRLGETLALKLEDIDVDRKTILIPALVTKGKKDRYVFFSNTMASILRKWLEYKDRYTNQENLIFTSKSGNSVTVSQFERNFRIYKNKASIEKEISPHGLRNNFAKRCLIAGMDIYTLSKILGHSSVTVTEKAYLDLTVTDIKKNYQRFSPLENIKNKKS